MVVAAEKKPSVANDTETMSVSPRSLEVVIALVGYAGAGCSDVSHRLQIALDEKGYDPKPIKLSKLIEKHFKPEELPKIRDEAKHKGIDKLERAIKLQDLGDKIRDDLGTDILIKDAIAEFQSARKDIAPGKSKIAFILDSLKHVGEVELLKNLYGPSFRLLSVHCSKPRRENRLIGLANSEAKFAGADSSKVRTFMERDEKDSLKKEFGQQVRDAFYLGDYFLDNDNDDHEKTNLNNGIDRFTDLLLGKRLFRPTREESGIYQAFAASRHSSCLSRQVGAALYSSNGRLIADGANEVPKFGGGVYGEDDGTPERRCFGWTFTSEGVPEFNGCHNTRKKHEIRTEIADWMKNGFAKKLAQAIDEKQDGFDAEQFISNLVIGVESCEEELEKAPGIGQLIEFSRSIHAEMDALLTASRSGYSTTATTLFCTTYPCHNCARHMVTAGVNKVIYVEPYVKSLALELHSDSLTDQETEAFDGDGKPQKMFIKAFTGVGPRMFDLHFKKSLELKNSDGSYNEPEGGTPVDAVRIDKLEENEKRVIDMSSTS